MTPSEWNHFANTQAWLLALATLVITLLLAPAVGAFLRHWKDHGSWSFLNRLSTPVSYLIYPLGLRIAIAVAPFTSHLEGFRIWLQAAAYILFVIALLNLIRQGAMIAVGWTSARASGNVETFQKGFIPLLKNLITVLIFLMGAIMILKYFGYDALSLITALGVGSLAVGLAAKDTLSNMISGFILIIDRNMRPGDKINLAGTVGIVEEIGLRSTRLNTRDGNILVVPNQDMVNTKILSMSLPGPESSCSTQFKVPFDIPFARIQTICQEVHDQVALAWKDKETRAQLTSIADGRQLVTVTFWVRNSDNVSDALTDFHVRLLERMSHEGIPLS